MWQWNRVTNEWMGETNEPDGRGCGPNAWGFGTHFAAQLCSDGEHAADADVVVARVLTWDGASGSVVSDGVWPAELYGRLKHQGVDPPVTGDWVVGRAEADRLVISRVLERKTALVRRVAGLTSRHQAIVANVDTLMIVTSANTDLNERRLERYLAAAWDSGARPVVVINKIDLVSDQEPWLERVKAVALGVDVLAVSAHTAEGWQALSALAKPGATLAFVGSSGVGKSSLINQWLGVVSQVTGAIDEVERGRHTTTRRALLQLPTGGLLVDTPGMREFGLTEAGDGLDATFDDIVMLARSCRFADCHHGGEPGCAVDAAVDSGVLAAERLASYFKLRREALAMQARTDQRLAGELKRQWKVRSKASRARYNQGHKGR